MNWVRHGSSTTFESGLNSWIEEDVCQNFLNLFADSMIGFWRLCSKKNQKVFLRSGPVKSRLPSIAVDFYESN